MILLYAVGVAGHGSLPPGVESYDAHGLAVLHREVAEVPTPDKSELVAFGTVVRELSRQGPILPMRFGSVLPDRGAMTDLLEERHQEWAGLLDRLAGHHELIVHLPPPGSGPGAAPLADGSGRSYLLARAAALHTEEEQVEQLRRLPAVRDVRVLPRGRVSLLVADAEEARRQVDRCVHDWTDDRGRSPEPAVRLTGPWPPFSFCEVTDP